MATFENPSNERDFNTANPVPAFVSESKVDGYEHGNMRNIVYSVVYEEEHLGFSGWGLSESRCFAQVPRHYQLGSRQAENGNVNPA
jgi:hypothetical protein